MNGAYSTDEELYSVSHTLTIPEASDKKFDLIAPGMSLSAWDFASVEPLIRINDGGTIYFDRSSARLEVLGDGGWTAAPAFEDDVSAVVYPMLDKDSELRYVPQEEQPRGPRNGDALKNLVQLPPIEMYIADPDAEYRLTLEFAEHEDGSGERYVLRLRFAP